MIKLLSDNTVVFYFYRGSEKNLLSDTKLIIYFLITLDNSKERLSMLTGGERCFLV